MFDSNSYDNPTPLAHTDTLRDVLPRGEVIDGIPLDATKIYTDGSKGETNTIDSGVLIELSGRIIKFQRRNADHASVFRMELIAIMSSLSFINIIRDLAFSEIWIPTDSRSTIQHLSNWPSIGDCTSRSILHLFLTAFGSAPYSSTVGPFSCRPSRERSCGRPCEGGTILWIRKTTRSLHQLRSTTGLKN
ncbi:RNase H domain-containing protein [Trichonephila clavipes]|nr:RNase H domain-containing protein [Trichonephila clavipes]